MLESACCIICLWSCVLGADCTTAVYHSECCGDSAVSIVLSCKQIIPCGYILNLSRSARLSRCATRRCPVAVMISIAGGTTRSSRLGSSMSTMSLLLRQYLPGTDVVELHGMTILKVSIEQISAEPIQIKRVPKTHLAVIRNIEFTICPRPYNGQLAYIFGNKRDGDNLNKMVKMFLKYFHTLETVKISYGRDSSYYYAAQFGSPMSHKQVLNALKKFLERFLKQKTVKRLEVFKDNTIPIHEAAEKILAERAEFAGVIVVPNGPVVDRRWNR